MTNIYDHKLLILDFGSQYTQLIGRRIREIGVYCEIHPFDVSAQFICNFAAKAIILSGGPDTVTNVASAKIPEVVFQLNIPVLGVCYGMHAMAMQLGGSAILATKHEYGFAKIRAHNHTKLLDGIADETNADGHGLLDVWMSHGTEVSQLPPGFKRIASSDNCEIAGFGDDKRLFYALQFHPEVTHTKRGKDILTRFIELADCAKQWTTAHIIDELVSRLKARIGQQKILLALSGGVDSSVTAALLHQAVGKQLSCIFVDNGLLRLNEGDEVMQTFADNMGIQVKRVNAQQRFLTALKGIDEPEAKRRIIGHQFIAVFDEEAQQLKDVELLAQGTIYPDVIESAALHNNKAKVIKSHHNVGGLPDDMKLKLVEPLRELFKDEVRQIGVKLGIPKTMLYRHPFPGPGLGVRILAEVKEEYADILRQADAIFMDELRQHNLYDKVNQAFAVFLPIKSVGVTGDERRYEFVIALRAVETVDFMTARWAKLPHDFLDIVSTRIINEVQHVSRVVYDISSKPPATIEWE